MHLKATNKFILGFNIIGLEISPLSFKKVSAYCVSLI